MRAQKTSLNKSRVSSKVCVYAVAEGEAVHDDVYVPGPEVVSDQARDHPRHATVGGGIFGMAGGGVRALFLSNGRRDEALAESNRALELDPVSPIINLHLGWHYLYTKQYDRALEQLA